MKEEPNLRRDIVERIRLVEPTLHRFFPRGSLKMGGGTILQARWSHRHSIDIDLFAYTREYNETISSRGSELEKALYSIKGVNPEKSWVELSTVYCEVNGVELTVMPSDPLIREDSGFNVSDTSIETETTQTILSKKIVNRMIEGGSFEIRDIFDIHTAISIDPESLTRAVTIIPENHLRGIVTLMKSLPETWFSETERPLLGVDQPVSQTHLVSRVCSYFERQLEAKGNGE